MTLAHISLKLIFRINILERCLLKFLDHLLRYSRKQRIKQLPPKNVNDIVPRFEKNANYIKNVFMLTLGTLHPNFSPTDTKMCTSTGIS